MNRLGWAILVIFLAAAIAFAFMFGSIDEDQASPPTPSAAPQARPAEVVGDLVIPVAGVKATQLADTWGQSRGDGQRRHNAIDIMAPRGTPVMAAAPGVVEKLFNSQQGGLTVYVRSTSKRIVHYYAHLDQYRDGLREGQAVRTGDVIGTVGFTGNANPAGPHLHFEVKRMREGESWHQGEPINPYPLLAGKASAR